MQHGPRLLIFSRGAFGSVSGVTRTASALADSLEARGWHVDLLHPAPTSQVLTQGPRRVHLTPLPAPVARLSREALRSVWGTVRALGRVMGTVRASNPDVIVVLFVDYAALYLLLAGRILRRPVVLSARGSDVHQSARTLRRKVFFRVCLGLSSGFLVKSPRMATDLALLSGPTAMQRKVEVVLDGVDTSYWTPAEQAGAASARPQLLAIGHLRPVKGFDILVEALAILQRGGRDVSCTIIGEGRLRDDLEEQAAALSLRNVEIVPFRSHDELRATYRNATLFVLASRSEGGANVLLEAVSCGLPAVSTDVGTSPQIIDESFGRIVPTEDSRALAVGIGETLDLIAAPGGRRTSRVAAREAALRSNWERSVDEYERVLSTVAERRRASN